MFVCKGCCCYCHVSHEIRNISIRQTLLPLPLRKLHLRLQLHHLPDRQHLPSQVPLDQHHLEFIKYFRVYQQNTNLDYDIHFRNATHQDSSFQDLSGRYLQSWNMNFSEYLNVVFVILASTFTITGNWVICLWQASTLIFRDTTPSTWSFTIFPRDSLLWSPGHPSLFHPRCRGSLDHLRDYTFDI